MTARASMKHPGPLVWFRFHAGDLSLFAWLSFQIHVARCSTCGTRLRAEQAERASVEAALDLARPAGPPRSRVWMAVPVLAAAALLFFVVRPSSTRVDTSTPLDDDLRAKGGSSFLVYVGSTGDGGAGLLGAECHPGDALQAHYQSEKPYLMIVGVDPTNEARTLVPLDGTSSTPIRPGVQSAPQSWVLDAMRGRERFVAFFSDVPLDAARAHAAALEERPRLDGAIAVVRECTKSAKSGAP